MIECTINGIYLKLDTDRSLFSPERIDIGTLTMLSKVTLRPGQKILDLGCGYGVVGIYAAHLAGAENVTMADSDPLAVELAGKNAIANHMEAITTLQSDGFDQIAGKEFDLILSNPPYHADFHVPKNFIEHGFRHLKYGGRMIMVTKRYRWYKNKLESVFGGVRVMEENGYYIFIAQKRSGRKPRMKECKGLSKKLRRKYGRS